MLSDIDIKIKKIVNEYDEYLDKKSNDVLHRDFFHSNITLSRNHLIGSNLLINLIKNSVLKLNFLNLLKNILFFYTRNIYYLCLWLIYYFFSKIISFKKINKLKNKLDEILIIQTYLNKNSFIGDDKISDNYFSELYSCLEKNNQFYYILPNIDEKMIDISNRLKIIRVLSNTSHSYLNEYDFFSFSDFIKLIKFVLLYPFLVIEHAFRVKSNTRIDQLYKYDLIQTLSKSSFIPYTQLLLGKKLRKIFKNKIVKIISWNENQLIHRNFCRGIQDSNIKIYGCQYFMKYPSCRWMYARENDKKFGVLPNIFLVTGKKYLPETSELKYKIGTSLRYRDVYNTENQAKKLSKVSMIVILPYEQEQSENLLDFIKNSKYLKMLNINIKIHPDYLHRTQFYKSKINKNWKIIDNKTDLTRYNIIITKASGSMIEFIAKGFSVLVVEDNNNPLALNPLSHEGKNIIWDTIDDPCNFKTSIDKLYENRNKKLDLINNISNQYKKNYFKEFSENELKKDFDI